MTKEGEGVATQFFAVRWLTTLFSREFSLEETLRVWDSLLGDPERLLLVYCVATALMQNVQSVLMEKDFSQAMQILQNVAIPSTETILQMADAIRFKELKGRREDTSLSSQLRRAGEDSDAVTVRAVGVVVAWRAVCGQEVGRFNDAL